MGDNYCGHASFAIDLFWAESDDEAQLAITKLREELADWISRKKSELVIYAVEVSLDPDNVETP